jgi:hypothetical protein
MKKTTQLGCIAFVFLLLSVTACTKSPSAKIYNMWRLEDFIKPSLDSAMLAKVDAQGVTYTFSKDGKYSVSGAINSVGTFEINEEGTHLITTEDGEITTYKVQLTNSMLKLSKAEESMIFKVKQ